MDNESKRLRYIVFTQMIGLGPVTQNAMLRLCGGIKECFEAEYEDLIHADEMDPSGSSKIGNRKLQSFIAQKNDGDLWIKAEEILRSSEKSRISVITCEDVEYPKRFIGLKDLPVVLYSKGSLRINDFKDSIGIVGARRCTAEGKKHAIDIATMISRQNGAVISGMAKGIDSYAQTAAIKSNGYTIGVLGNGVDICYPKEHERLYEEIIEHGCVLSEYLPGTRPREYNFPRRNRLIAALSDRLYVIDTGRNSGTLSTVESGRKYDREIKIVK